MQFSPLRALGQGLVIILICAVSAEVSLRIFNTFVPTFIFYDDSYERYRGRSGESDWGFPLNSLGFKDTEWGEAAVRRASGRAGWSTRRAFCPQATTCTARR